MTTHGDLRRPSAWKQVKNDCKLHKLLRDYERQGGRKREGLTLNMDFPATRIKQGRDAFEMEGKYYKSNSL